MMHHLQRKDFKGAFTLVGDMIDYIHIALSNLNDYNYNIKQGYNCLFHQRMLCSKPILKFHLSKLLP